jgi:hypothetical protein
MNINPEYAEPLNIYFTYWLHYLSIPTIGVFILTLVYLIDLQQKKLLTQRKKYDRLFK